MSLVNACLLAGLITIAIAAVTHHLLATIGGAAVFFLLRWWLGQRPIEPVARTSVRGTSASPGLSPGYGSA